MIGFAGLSNLGVVSSIAGASKGFEVVAYDPDPARCRELAAGRLPVVERGLPELLASSRPRMRFTPAPDPLGGCGLIFCSADVPTTAEDRSELSAVTQLMETVVSAAAPGTVLVVSSQVPPGWTRRLEEAVQRDHPGRSLQVFYQAETLIIGRAVERALQPERFIVGCRDPRRELPGAYAAWLGRFACPVLPMRYESAELAKIAVNLFLASSVCTANTLAELCEALSADWSEIVPALRLDRRIGPHAYLTPGLGLSGGNLERDMATAVALAGLHGTEAGLIDAWLSDSQYRRDWVLRRLSTAVLSTTPARPGDQTRRAGEAVIAVWGLAYKATTASMKNAPSLALLDALSPYRVQAYDPAVSLDGLGGPHVVQSPSALEACRGADALVILTPWAELSEVPPAKVRALMRGRVLIDPFGVVEHARCLELGLRHVRLGAPAPREDEAASRQGAAA